MRQLKITKQVTNRETPSLDKYLHEIGKEDLISAEEEILLAKRIKQGDQKAIEKMIRANLRFVVSVAKQYQNQGLTLSDLINEGNLGLIKATQRFDEDMALHDILLDAEEQTPDGDLSYDSLKTEIHRILNSLTDRESVILQLYFGLNGNHPHTLDEIGLKVDLTRERVRQIREKALRKLKCMAKEKVLRGYL